MPEPSKDVPFQGFLEKPIIFGFLIFLVLLETRFLAFSLVVFSSSLKSGSQHVMYLDSV